MIYNRNDVKISSVQLPAMMYINVNVQQVAQIRESTSLAMRLSASMGFTSMDIQRKVKSLW